MRTIHGIHPLEIESMGIGCTVRKGFKWADGNPMEGFILCVCSDRCVLPQWCGRFTTESPVRALGSLHKLRVGEVWSCENCTAMGYGEVRERWVGRFNDIPIRFIRFMDEQRARTYEGLLESMRKAYLDFFDSDFVTVLSYLRLE